MEEKRSEFDFLNRSAITPAVAMETMDMIREDPQGLRELMSCYRCAMMEMETKFRVLDDRFSLEKDRNPIVGISTRLKSLDSIVEKCQRRGFPVSLDTIANTLNDVAGVRIICPFVDDIYVLVDCLLRQDDVQILQVKDYIKHPKENGYRSLHLIVSLPIFLQEETRVMRVEVQLRTIAMDFWASLDHRMQYKKSISPAQSQKLNQDLRECADISAMLDRRMQDIRDRLDEEAGL